MPKRRQRKMRRGKGKRKGRNVLTVYKGVKNHFPPIFHTKLTVAGRFTQNGTALASDGAASYNYWKHNSILNCGQSFQATTAVAPTGYTASFPGCINWLLSTDPNINAYKSPYFRFLVKKSTITVKITQDLNAAGANVNRALQVVIAPHAADFGTSAGCGQSIGNLKEGYYSKSCVLSPVQTQSVTMRNSISTNALFGLSRLVATNDAEFVGTAVSDPNLIGNWIMGINNADGNASEYYVSGQFYITYDVMFYDRNLVTSAVPV